MAGLEKKYLTVCVLLCCNIFGLKSFGSSEKDPVSELRSIDPGYSPRSRIRDWSLGVNHWSPKVVFAGVEISRLAYKASDKNGGLNVFTKGLYDDVSLLSIRGNDLVYEFFGRLRVVGYIGCKRRDDGHLDITIAFRGTSCREDVLIDINADKIDMPFIVAKQAMKGRVHKGFFCAYSSVQKDMKEILIYLLEKHDHYAGCTIHIVGHSMGGALANLAAVDIARDPDVIREASSARVELLTFSSPRVFDKAAAQSVGELQRSKMCLPIHILRVKHGGDPIPFLPPSKLGFQHVGDSLSVNPDVGTAMKYHSLRCLGNIFNERFSLGNISGIGQRDLRTEGKIWRKFYIHIQ